MTDVTNNPYADIIDAAVNAPGAMDATQKQSFEARKPARAGVALFRFVSYIETGEHTVKSGKGKGKKQNWADFGFELVHPDHMIGEGENARPDTLELRNYNISTNEKAKYKLLFDQMNAALGSKYTSFAQMLGAGFLGKISHNVVGAGTAEEKTYVNLDSIGAPRYQPDPMADVWKEIAVPPVHGDITLFMFDAPGHTAEMVQRMWNGIEITGDKADGTPKKNWIQDKIRSANNWEGSFTQSVVGGDALVVQEVADDIAAATAAAVADPLASLPANDSPIDTTAAVAAGATVVEDPLAGIAGL